MRVGTFSGGGLGFGVAFTLEDQFTAVADRINSRFDKLANETEAVSERLTQSFDRIYKGAGLVAAGVAMLAPVGFAVKVAGEFEQISVAFETLIGDAGRANKLVWDLKKFADLTPFTDDDILKSGRMLVAFGKQAEDVIPVLDNLGNVAAGVGMSMGSLVEIYGRNLAQPKLMTRDIYQIANHGIPIIDALAVALNTAKTNVLDLVGSGTVGIKDMERAFELMGQEGGLFANMMVRQSTTMNGLASTAESYFKGVMRSIGGALLPGIKTILSGVIIPALEAIRNFALTGLGKFVVYVMLAVIGIAALSLILVGLKLIFFGLAMAVTTVTTTMLPAIAAGALLAAQFYILYKLLSSNNALIYGLGVLLAIVLGPIGMVAAGVYTLIRAWQAFSSVVDGTTQPQKGLLGWLQRLGGYMQGIIQIFKSATSEGWEMSLEMEQALASIGILDTVIDMGTWIVRIKELLRGMRDGAVEAFGDFSRDVRYVIDLFDSVAVRLGVTDSWFNKNSQSMDSWKTTGEAAGGVIYGVLSAIVVIVALLTVKLAAMAVSTLAAFWPVLVVIGLVAAGIYLIMGLVESMKGVWDSVADTALGKSLGMNTFDYSQGEMPFNSEDVKMTDKTRAVWESLGAGRAEIQATQASMGGAGSINTNTTKQILESLTVSLEMDGDKLMEKLIEKAEINNARSGKTSGASGGY